jgi:hypothetical protein
MTEWFYRATSKKIPFDETKDLAVNEGFLCRSAYEDNGTRADSTQDVQFRDVIHMYFTGDGEPRAIGTFEVVGPNRHPKPGRFGKAVRGTVLFEVDDAFAKTLTSVRGADGEGYAPDPVLKRVTGWALVQRTDLPTPPFQSAPFTARATLVRRRP